MQPFFTEVSGAPPTQGTAVRNAFVLHGILGSSKNWYSFCRRLAQSLPGWRLILVDLRHHGESQTQERPDSLRACADDLATLARTLGVAPDAVIGHSFGGKVALVYAREHATPALRDVWVLDANPSARDPRGSGGAATEHEVVSVLRTLRSIPTPVASRAVLTEALTSQGYSTAFAGWMTTNLAPLPSGGFGWRFDLEGVQRLLDGYFAEDLWPFLESQPSPNALRVHMLRGARSDRFSADEVARLDALAARGAITHPVLEGAGHWVHVDAPDALSALLVDSLAAR